MPPLVTIFDKIKFNCFCGSPPKTLHDDKNGETEKGLDYNIDEERCKKHARVPKTSCEISSQEEQIVRDRTRYTKNKKSRNRRNASEDRHRYTIYDEVRTAGERYNITILPVHANFCIDNLYPETNQVHKWNIIIIGKDKTFIHVSIHDLDLPEYDTFPNRRAGNVLDRHLQDFFDPIFEKTLSNQKLQFVMGWSHRIFLVNTYPLNNQFGNVIGAVIFIRNYSLMPKMTFAPLTHDTSDREETIVHRRSRETAPNQNASNNLNFQNGVQSRIMMPFPG